MKINHWLKQRAEHQGPLPHEQISKQRRLALWMTIFSAIRTVVWLIAMLIIVLYWVGVHSSIIHWEVGLSSTVIFVTFISFYCNASTDAANLAASIAALFSADSHRSAETTRQIITSNFADVESDIAELAELEPGPRATALADEIKSKLNRQS